MTKPKGAHHDIYQQYEQFAKDNHLRIDPEYYESGDLVLGFTNGNRKPCFSYPYKTQGWGFDEHCNWVLRNL